MKKILVSIALLAAWFNVFAQQPPKPYGALPSQRQLSWQQTDMYCIVHFSMATYTDKEWGFGDEDPAIFNPKNFSAMQIVGAAKAGGFKGIVVVAKHHDGFCLWPTKTTEHNVSKSPYENGKGDILKDYQLACQKLGMKMAVYCSPWDRNNTLYGKPEYVTQIYRKQLEELYTNYGPLFMSWHDGANGGDGYYGGAREIRKIDRSTYYGWDTTWAITRKMQPGASIFGDVGPDVRWVGNEEGHAGDPYWATFTPEAPEPGKKPSNGFLKDNQGTEGTRNGKYWMPAECDVPLRSGWFYHASQAGQSKSAYTLLDLYYKSVGRGACLDLGLSPDKDGIIDEEDVNILKQFGALLNETFKVNYAKGAKFKASNTRGNSAKFSTANLLDNSRYSYWATDDKVTDPELTVNLPGTKTFNVVRLRENIKLGQRIDGVTIEAWEENTWKQIGALKSVGANRLLRLPVNVSTNKLRLKFKSPVCITLSDFGLFKEPVHLTPPVISRNVKGEVTIATESPVNNIHYTIDGSDPGLNSPVYEKPFRFYTGGVVRAVSYENKAMHSVVKTQNFGLAKTGWKVITTEDTQRASEAIDEETNTYWSTNTGKIVVDMAKANAIKGFAYLPRQDKKSDGTIDSYSFSVSDDNISWNKVADGEFANIKSNPVEQTVILPLALKCRYFKLEAKHVVSGSGVTIAEIGVN